MFSQTTASRFFTLFCLWVNVLSIAASPVSYESEGSPPTQFGPPLPPPRRIQNLQILTTHFEEVGEHSSLFIGTTSVHALTEDGIVRPSSILTPEKSRYKFTAMDFEGFPGSKQTSLGKASFRDQAEEEEAIDKILELKLPRYDQGGNCRDFIRHALGLLIRKKK